jgi:hypothetical protein
MRGDVCLRDRRRYTILYGAGGDLTPVNVEPPALTSTVPLDPAAGLATFSVFAWNVAGAGANGTAVLGYALVAASPPEAPEPPTGTPGNGAVSVEWGTPPDNGAPIDGCTVQLAPCPSGGSSGGSACVACSAAGPGAAACVATGLTNGVGYSFRVACHNSAGTGAASEPSALVYPSDSPHSIPGTPTLYATGVTR